jgi:hypothetical protein
MSIKLALVTHEMGAWCGARATLLQYDARWGLTIVSASRAKCPSLLPYFDKTTTWHMGRECHVWCLRHPAAIRREMGTKNCLGVKGRVSIFTARCRPNCHWLWRMGMECHVWYLSNLIAMRGEIGTKNSLCFKRKAAFVTARFRTKLQSWRM